MNNTLGLSLSFCIKNHLQNGTPLPDAISSSTRCETPQQYQQVIDSYKRVYWREFPEEAQRIAWAYWNNSKLEQPRMFGEPEGLGPNNYEQTRHPLGQWYVYTKDLNNFILLTQQER